MTEPAGTELAYGSDPDQVKAAASDQLREWDCPSRHCDLLGSRPSNVSIRGLHQPGRQVRQLPGVMVGAMALPCILLIPDRFSDYRMWSDIPDRLQGRAKAIHFDQHGQIPWTTGAADEFADAARRLAPDGRFDIVVGKGQAARFAFALAEAGLAKGLVFFQPSLDCLPDDLHVDWSAVAEGIELTLPIVEAVGESDPARRRDILLHALRDMAGPDAESAELEMAIAMYGDHADEYFGDLRDTAAAADGRAEPDPPWISLPWIDRLGELTVPVTVVGARVIGEAIARRARHAEIVDVMGGGALLAPAESRTRAAAALLRMLDRIS